MKQLDYGKMSEKDRKQMMAEVAILESLKHRNIVQLYQKIRDPKQERIYILMEVSRHSYWRCRPLMSLVLHIR